MSRSIVFIFLFFASCILLFWNPFWSVNQEPKSRVTDTNLPDFTATDMTQRQFDDEGYLSSMVSAQHMEHFDSNITTFDKPSYIIYPKRGDARWKIDADIGIFDQDQRVLLKNNVTITAIDPNEKIQTIRTSYLELNLDTMIVTSDQLVKIAGKQFQITGQGLQANFNLKQFELIKDIQAVYENNQS